MWKKCCCLCARETYEPPDVQELDYRHSSLTEVPPEIFTYERTLERLLLGSNQISDLPPNLFYCHELRELDLCDNDLKEIPAAIESLNRIAKLNVCRNALAEVPESIKNCKNLTYLDLSLNQLSKIPEAVCQLVHLEELFLNETALDFLPANFGRLTKLKNLELRDNMLVSLPMSMNRLNQLQRLDIGCNEIEELPTVIGSMTNLLELWADDNTLRLDANTKVLGSLPKLTCIDLSKNNLATISDQIGKCGNLTDITLSFNDLSAMPGSFTKLESACTIRIDSNRLVSLPEDFGKLRNLQECNLSFNLLKSIPLSIGLLRKLHTLYLDGNRLTELPKEIGSCTSLSVLSVANNSITEIPSEIGHLSNLRVLVLTNNSIRNLPVSILGLTNLGALWLTEGQNKPLVTLNREIDSATGQHVVTCCLLPQLPSPDVIVKREEAEEALPRRSGRKIRFETDVEPSVHEKPAANGGLLRAPTPYPKELRAMAKHASHIRQAKNQNGEAINISDEPMYEGDMNEDSTDYQARQNFELRLLKEGRSDTQKETYQQHHHYHNQEERSQHDNDIVAGFTSPQSQYIPPPSNDSHSKINPVATATAPREFPYPPRTGAISQQSDVDDASLVPTSATAAIGRTPPPYHIAAQRAAFLRSSGGAGSGKINFPTELKNNITAEASTTPTTNHHVSPETPPMSPDVLAGGAVLNNTYEPVMVVPLPQSSNSSSSALGTNRVPSAGNIDDCTQQDTYEPANVNAILLQYKNLGGLPPPLNHHTTVASNDHVMGGIDAGDMNNIVPATMLESAPIPANHTNDMTGYCSGIQPDRNGNITTNKTFNYYEDHSSNSVPMYSNANVTAHDDVARDEVMPPAMPLLKDVKEHHQHTQQLQPRNTEPSQIPTMSHNKGANYKSDSKICRIPSLQSAPQTAASGKKHYPNSQVSHIATPSRISTIDHSETLSPPAQREGHSLISHLKYTPTAKVHPEQHYAASKAANASRIPSSMYSSAEARPASNISKRHNAALPPTGLKYSSGGASPGMGMGGSASSGIPKLDFVHANSPGSHQQQQPQPDGLKSYSRIPKLEAPRALPEDMSLRSSSSTDEEKRSAYSSSGASEKSYSRGISPKLSRPGGSGRDSDHGIESKIPGASRKPWIFGSHRNARVVSVEHRKVNQFKLGFSIIEFAGQNHPEGKGIYVTASDSEDLSIKVGDKILQVDGIDVGDMGVEIVNKILSNCQENIQLLVSRQH